MKEWITNAWAAQYIGQGGVCEHCGGNRLSCSNAPCLLGFISVEMKCADCDKMTFWMVEDA